MAKDLLQKLAEYRSVDDVAKLLDVNPTTVLRWLNSGDLVGFQLGKQWRIAESDVERFIDDQRERQARKIARRKAENQVRDELKRRQRHEPTIDFDILLCDFCLDWPVVVRKSDWQSTGQYCAGCVNSGDSYGHWPARLGPRPDARIEGLPF